MATFGLEKYIFIRSGSCIRKVLCLILIGTLVGCASNPKNDGDQNFVRHERDKFEGFNRAMFAFNDTLDRWVLKPVAKGYVYIAPEPVEIGVKNFFSNLGEISNVFNDVLQWKWKTAGVDTGRFLINSTVGILGFFDVAQHMGLEENDGEDFGQTLAKWGVGEGSYLVLPFLGPTTLRDGFGKPIDIFTNPVTYVEPSRTAMGLTATDLIQTRAQLLDVEDLIQGDKYVMIRSVYLQRRDFLNNDGVVEDDFGDEEFEDEDF